MAKGMRHLRSLVGALAAVAAATFVPMTAGPVEAACAYFEDNTGNFYIDLETGAWRLVSPFDISGAAADELELKSSGGRFSDTTESGAELRGMFHSGGAGWVTFRERSTDRSVRIADRSVQVANCN
jgi:hypothetical protein